VIDFAAALNLEAQKHVVLIINVRISFITGKPALSPSEVNRALSGAGFRPTMKLADCHYLWSFARQGLTPAGRAHTGGLKTAKSDNQHFQKGALSLMLRKRNSKVSGEEAQGQKVTYLSLPVANTGRFPAAERGLDSKS